MNRTAMRADLFRSKKTLRERRARRHEMHQQSGSAPDIFVEDSVREESHAQEADEEEENISVSEADSDTKDQVTPGQSTVSSETPCPFLYRRKRLRSFLCLRAKVGTEKVSNASPSGPAPK